VADNRAQAEYWNSPITEPWVRLQERLDAFFAPLPEAGIAAEQPAPGEHALDIGCGCGATVLALAERVGTAGT
jgi:methylase of polypeptide subunit release factors